MQDYTSASSHRKDILTCHQCGCFYCLQTFLPEEITEWCDFDDVGIGQTALCPKCGIDSVIGVRISQQVDMAYLKKLNQRGFGDS